MGILFQSYRYEFDTDIYFGAYHWLEIYQQCAVWLAGSANGRSLQCSGYGNYIFADKMVVPVFSLSKENIPARIIKRGPQK